MTSGLNQLKSKVSISLIILSAGFVVSLFLPITHLRLLGDISYYRALPSQAYLLIVLCLTVIVFLRINLRRSTLIPIFGLWITLFTPFIEKYLFNSNQNLFTSISQKAGGSFKSLLTNIIFGSADLTWGGYLMLVMLTGITLLGILKLVSR